MSKICPQTGERVLYLTCQECEDKRMCKYSDPDKKEKVYYTINGMGKYGRMDDAIAEASTLPGVVAIEKTTVTTEMICEYDNQEMPKLDTR